ncbi:MAG: chromate efflux transporter [Planctomycetes bacterium]|nr:chromate efflux transporter [Planctomycetota bacterium]
MNKQASQVINESATLATTQHPRFATALRFWLKLGFVSFGGPTGQIAIMHTELVEKRRWISEARFLHALNYCMLLPGPEAQQLATYIGWLLHRTWGGVVAGGLFVLPSVAILWLLSYVYVAYGDVGWIAAAFYGLKPTVLAIVAAAVIRIGRRALKNGVMWAIAGGAFVAIFFLDIPFPVIILAAGIIGLLGFRFWPTRFKVLKAHGPMQDESAVIGDEHASPDHARPSLGRSMSVIVVCGLLWWVPILLVFAWLGSDHAVFHQGIFFSKAALVTFGGAYAVLPYVAQQAVDRFGWLAPGQMLDGLGLAETTPGPLIMVVQFVGFVGAWNNPGDLPPLLAATLGALITTWVTFVPCFLWIFLGAPYIEHLRTSEWLTAGLSGITAAVVGVVLNLAVWFGLHVLWPEQSRVDWFAVLVAAAALIALVRLKVGVVAIVGCGALAGVLSKSVGL